MFLEVSVFIGFCVFGNALEPITKRLRFENREFKIYDTTEVTTPQILHI